MRQLSRLLGGLLSAILIETAVSTLPAQNQYANRPAPDFSLADRQGQWHTLADCRGKILLLNVMKTDCPHCKTLMAALQQIEARYRARVAVLSIVVPPDNVSTVNEFVRENHVTSPILLDNGRVTAAYLNLTPQNPTITFPQLILVDGEGTIRAHFGAEYPASAPVLQGAGLPAEVDRLLSAAPAGLSGFQPSVRIERLQLKPAAVPAGAPFDLEVEFSAMDPSSAAGGRVPVEFSYSILDGANVVMKTQPESVQVLNGGTKLQVEHLDASRRAGSYTIRVQVRCGNQVAEESVQLRVQ